MFYEPRKGDHGLPHDPFKSCVVPRPIGWISSRSKGGVVNLAPYSYFNALSSAPPMVMFSSNGHKDSLRNCEETGEFVVNIATWELREEVNATSYAFGPQVDEMAEVGLTPGPCRLVDVPRVARSPIALECRTWKTISLPGMEGASENTMIIGEVIGVHIDESVLTEGRIDLAKVRPIARLGYMDFAVIDEVFSMARPKQQ